MAPRTMSRARCSAGQEGGRVVRGDGLGAEGLLAEGFSFAAQCGVEDEDAVGEGGDAGVAADGGGGGGTEEAVGEGGEEQEASGGPDSYHVIF